MKIQILILLINTILINLAFLLSFLVRYGLDIPEFNFHPFKKSFLFLTLIHISALAVFGVYKSRFKSSWELFKRVFSGLFLGTLLGVAFVYVFRAKWGAFPTSVFTLYFFISLLLVFKVNQLVLKAKKKIKKKVVIIGEDYMDDISIKKAAVERKTIDDIYDLIKFTDVDEIVICERIRDEKALNLLAFLVQKLKVDIVFSPAIYMTLLPERLNGENSIDFLSTFVGKKRDIDEFLIRGLDIVGSLAILLISTPVLVIVSLLVKISDPGTVLYKQQRIGKDGNAFTLYKFRTMVKDAEKKLGPVLASRNDPRNTKVGKVLRTTRLDELPQLLNVLKGDMSLVGPRPERAHFVKQHKALQELRLTVRPGLTGLAQIRSFYDLKPRHKIKYDYLYIQRRSFLLNLYILLQTVPVVFSKKGW
jgi:lipopolysaccharide/colanic/teichoic acid biosynthesis glycosyltransferase